MIAVHLLSPAQVAEALQQAGCKFCMNLDRRHDLWKTSWGFVFTVPKIGDDGWCPKYVLFEILADIERLRPDGHKRGL